MDFMFFLNTCLLGVGLAMDAFSVSLANGLNEPKMGLGRMSLIAGTFAVFQFVMPMTGWICIHTIVEYFKKFEKFIPWIGFAILLWIGGEMIIEGIKGAKEEEIEETKTLSFGKLMIQGIGTSIDALSVGFTIEQYDLKTAIIASLIIGIITFVICISGVEIGKKFGMKLSKKATILGGCILVGIGIEILVGSFI
jgi:manganese efflux pump family protein